ncbi:FUSC family protein [Agrobacterium sp. MOPV5]|nr:FUSC family protein [Agrobacterium leguminum]
MQFGFAASIAAWIAVAVATYLQIPNSHWAGITVFTVAQPTRGLLLEKSIWRLAGTGLGAVAGYIILVTCHGAPGATVCLLTIWLSGCASAAAFLRHFRSYGAVLAGYTCAIIVLLTAEHPTMAYEFASARVLCTFIGVLSATAVSGLIVPKAPIGKLDMDLNALRDEVLEWIGSLFHHDRNKGQIEKASNLIAQMGAIEAVADEILDGSPGAIARKKEVRRRLTSLLRLVGIASNLRSHLNNLDEAKQNALLNDLNSALLDNKVGGALPNGERRYPEAISKLVNDLFAGIAAVADLRCEIQVKGSRRLPKTLLQLQEHDPYEALRAGARTAMVVIVVGAFWIMSGWPPSAFMLVSACVFVTVFAANDNGQANVRRVLPGVIAGVSAGLLYRELIFPSGSPVVDMIVGLAPFTILSGLGLSSAATAISAVEYNNFFLMMSQPSHSIPLGPPLAEQAIALIIGVTIALILLHAVFPRSWKRRRSRLLHLINDDLDKLSMSKFDGRASRISNRILLRLLRLTAFDQRVAGQERSAGLKLLLMHERLLTDVRNPAAIPR